MFNVRYLRLVKVDNKKPSIKIKAAGVSINWKNYVYRVADKFEPLTKYKKSSIQHFRLIRIRFRIRVLGFDKKKC